MNTAQEQFIEDYTLIVDNTQPAYDGHMYTAKQMQVGTLAEKLQNDFESVISQVTDLAREKGLTIGADLIQQMLIGYGFHTFHKIALHYKELAGE